MDPRDAPRVPPAFAELARELRGRFRRWEEAPEPWPEGRLDALARRAFRLQFEGNEPYRLYCRRRGVGPRGPAGWRDVPPVPTAGFRAVALCVGGAAVARLVFRTSGTSRGPGGRGRHFVIDPDLYRAAAEAGFRRQVLAGAGAPPGGWRIGSLLPPFEPAADSSLSWMADAVLRRFGGPGSDRLAGPDGPRWREAERFLERACADDVPVCLLATTLAADAWTRRLESRGARFRLPAGSRLMDTGGAKGKAGLRRGEVLARLDDRLGLSADDVVNEFGMTELLSQRYSRPPTPAPGGAPSGRAGSEKRGSSGAGASPPLHGPPWLRTRALDPVTLEEVPEGDVGILCHFDLANAGSVCAVLTEDVGRVREGAVRWVGRSPGAPPRGCSLATAELLAAQEDHRVGEERVRAGPGGRGTDEVAAAERDRGPRRGTG